MLKVKKFVAEIQQNNISRKTASNLSLSTCPCSLSLFASISVCHILSVYQIVSVIRCLTVIWLLEEFNVDDIFGYFPGFDGLQSFSHGSRTKIAKNCKTFQCHSILGNSKVFLISWNIFPTCFVFVPLTVVWG